MRAPRLNSNPIFVFGSNLAGRHGKGAAAFAKRFHGAIQGQGEGAQGSAYAIPTKDERLRTLPLEAIAQAVERFLEYVTGHPDLDFRITRIGCGLAGYKDTDILPLFYRDNKSMANCHLPGTWAQRLNETLMRVIVAGGRDYGKRKGEINALFSDLDRIREKHPDRQLEIVGGTARGADALGERWARDRGVPLARFPADWGRYGKAAGFVRNQTMAWYGTHLVAYWDGRAKGTGHMIETAQAEGLASWVRRYAPSVASD